MDPGCHRPSDRDETDPPVAPICSDGNDNDGDGVIDYPLDFGCQSAADNDEIDVCGQGVRTLSYPFGAPSVLNNTENGSTAHTGSCEASAGPERIFVYENPHNANLRISVNHPDTIQRTTVYARSACDSGELGCSRGGDEDQFRGTIELERVAPGPVFIFVDHPFGLGGAVRLSVEAERLPPVVPMASTMMKTDSSMATMLDVNRPMMKTNVTRQQVKRRQHVSMALTTTATV